MIVAGPNDLTRQLMRLFGIPPNSTAFEIRCAIDEVITIKVWAAADVPHPDGQLQVFGEMTEYYLCKKDGA